MADTALPVAGHGLIDAGRAAFACAANPAKAPDMQRYMKSDMPYLGIAPRSAIWVPGGTCNPAALVNLTARPGSARARRASGVEMIARAFNRGGPGKPTVGWAAVQNCY
ncbi:MAG: hypothetical protein ABIJ48_05195 [Actinomycetota bacterium]